MLAGVLGMGHVDYPLNYIMSLHRCLDYYQILKGEENCQCPSLWGE